MGDVTGCFFSPRYFAYSDGRSSDAPSNDPSSATGTAETTPTTSAPEGGIVEGTGTVAKSAGIGSGSTPTSASSSSNHAQHLRQIKPLLTVSSRLGRSLAELFGLLVKLSVGKFKEFLHIHKITYASVLSQIT